MEFFIYLIKVNIAIVILYGFYGLFFRNDTFFRWKRILLLSIPLIAMLYPLFDISLLLNNKVLTTSNSILFPTYYINEIIITISRRQSENSFSLMNCLPVFLAGIYGLSVTVYLVYIMGQMITLFLLLLQTQKMKISGLTIYRKKGLKTPLSFFRYIILDPQQYSADELQEIIRHEEAHVRQYHSLDMILAEIMTAFCWFNPVIWLMKREIRMNLEYLADRSVIDSGLGKEHYQFHLLRLTYHKAAAKITNNFNVSPLKKRIFMMNKKDTPRLGLAKYLLVLPVIAALLIFNNCDKSTKNTAIVKTKTDAAQVENLPESPEVKSAAEATETESEGTPDIKTSNQLASSENIFVHVEQMPQFPGGEAELMKWLHANITYPTIASEQGIEGKVILRFVVRSDGSIEGVQIVKSLEPNCDKEAVSAVKKMPKWIPGKQGGKPVSVYFNMPIKFQLRSK